MKKLILVVAATLFAASAYAETPKADAAGMGGDCEAKAISKSGKPLAGAAKKAFVKKCMQGAAEAKPMPKSDMKPMPKPEPSAGAKPQQQRMKVCAAEGKGKKGDDYKMFMKKCLSNK